MTVHVHWQARVLSAQDGATMDACRSREVFQARRRIDRSTSGEPGAGPLRPLRRGATVCPRRRLQGGCVMYAAVGDAARARMVTTRMWTLNTNTQAGNRSSSQGMTPTVRSSAAAVR